MRWYVSQDRKSEGPYSEQRIAMLIGWGKISMAAYVCDEHASNWIPITRTAFALSFKESARDSSAIELAQPQRVPALRGGPLRFSRRALQRLSAVIAGAAMTASVLTLAAGLSANGRNAHAATALPAARQTRRLAVPPGHLQADTLDVSHRG